MTDNEILKKAIEKAEKNGFNIISIRIKFFQTIYPDSPLLHNTEHPKKARKKAIDFVIHHNKELIFSIDFAEAFWGCRYVVNGKTKKEMYKEYEIEEIEDTFDFDWSLHRKEKAWKYHQHKMLDEVQSGRNPLKYLEKFL